MQYISKTMLYSRSSFFTGSSLSGLLEPEGRSFSFSYVILIVFVDQKANKNAFILSEHEAIIIFRKRIKNGERKRERAKSRVQNVSVTRAKMK